MISNYISHTFQSKVKLLCAEYKCLLSPHRSGFLKTLAEEFAVDHTRVQDAAKSLVDNLVNILVNISLKLQYNIGTLYFGIDTEGILLTSFQLFPLIEPSFLKLNSLPSLL
jgi:hypothetical protein